MQQAELLNILSDWSFWSGIPRQGIQRQLKLPPALSRDIVLIIQGVRRGGKSTLLTQLPHHYGLPFSHCFYCNFEDPRLLGSLGHSLLQAIIELARESISANEACYFFFDEIQHVEGFEKWLHVQLERPKNNYYIVTGSNSALLSGEYGSALTGRHITLTLHPFSFSEFQSALPQASIDDYLQQGGFPRALSFEEPKQLLQEYFNDIISRDVQNRVHARNTDTIKQVAKMAFDCCGSELSYRKIAAVTGISNETVKLYLDACEQAYLLFACPYFAYSERKRNARQKKYYPVDTGLRFAVTRSAADDLGKSLELVVYLRLKQRYEQVYYWQELYKGEMDFVVLDDKRILPFQVSFNGALPRHEKSNAYFYEAFPNAETVQVITRHNAGSFLEE